MSAISRILWHKNGFWVVKEKITSQYNSFDALKLRVITKNNESINAWARWKRKKNTIRVGNGRSSILYLQVSTGKSN